MADVTISQLTPGTPAGNNVVPYSTGSNTLKAPVSALFQESSFIQISTQTYPDYNYTGAGSGRALLTLGDYNRLDSSAIRFTQAGGTHIIGNNRTQSGGPNQILNTASNADFVINNAVVNPGTSIIFATSATERMRINKDGNVGIGTASPTSFLDVRGLMGTAYTSPTTVPPGTTATVLDPTGDRLANPPVFGHFNEWVRSTFNVTNYSFIVQATCTWGVVNAADTAVFLILYNHGIQSCEIKRIDNGYMRYNGDTFVSGGGAGAFQRPVIKLTHTGTGSAAPKFVVQLLGT